MKNSKLCVQKYQRELLIRSEYPKQFPKLVKLLNEKEKLTREELSSLKLDKDTENLILYSLEDIYKESAQEWKAELNAQDLENERIPCTLCNTPNRYMCHITNIYTDQKINVGTECVKHFSETSYKVIKKKKNKIIKEKRKAERKAMINETFPYLEEELRDKRNNLDNNLYVIPFKDEEKIISIINNIKKNYDNYLQSKNNDKHCFTTIKNNLDSLKIIFDDIKIFNENAKNNYLSCDLHTKKWLIKQGKSDVLEQIKNNNGLIDENTIPHIYFEDFLKKISSKLSKYLTLDNLIYSKLENNRIYINLLYSFKIENKEISYKIELFCPIKKFMEQHGRSLIEISKCPTEDLIKVFNVNSNSENEIYILYNEILNKYNYEIQNDDGIFEFLKIKNNVWTHKSSGDSNIFFENTKIGLLRDYKSFEKILLNTFNKISKWKSKKEIREIGQLFKNH